MQKINLGEMLIKLLEQNNVEYVFGIPGVHTVELYRALSQSKIRHITPRHEQGAGFMADGYARLSGKPGVCIVITGPGITNLLTAMAQARSDSIPMLVISGVNKFTNDNTHRAPLHDLPDQGKLVRQIALASYTIREIKETPSIFNKAFSKMTVGKPGPVHIQIPLDIMSQTMPEMPKFKIQERVPKALLRSAVLTASRAINKSKRPCIILGGGARSAKEKIKKIVETLEAPTISTVNARDLLGKHHLHIPASPSLISVRKVLNEADLVLALGTEMGQTDFDMYEDGLFPELKNLIRVDIDEYQLRQSPSKTLILKGEVDEFCAEILKHIKPKNNGDSEKLVKLCVSAVQDEIPKDYEACKLLLSTLVQNLPEAIIIGDSTQPSYYGNLCTEISNKNRWFNSATGFGTLGYAIPASIGAQLANLDRPVICIIGDGGLQFTLAELGTAIDEKVPVLFLVWNNAEYKEIRTFMESKEITPIGISPKPPKLKLIAKSYDMEFKNIKNSSKLSKILIEFSKKPRPLLIEITENTFKD